MMMLLSHFFDGVAEMPKGKPVMEHLTSPLASCVALKQLHIEYGGHRSPAYKREHTNPKTAKPVERSSKQQQGMRLPGKS